MLQHQRFTTIMAAVTKDAVSLGSGYHGGRVGSCRLSVCSMSAHCVIGGGVAYPTSYVIQPCPAGLGISAIVTEEERTFFLLPRKLKIVVYNIVSRSRTGGLMVNYILLIHIIMMACSLKHLIFHPMDVGRPVHGLRPQGNIILIKCKELTIW